MNKSRLDIILPQERNSGPHGALASIDESHWNTDARAQRFVMNCT